MTIVLRGAGPRRLRRGCAFERVDDETLRRTTHAYIDAVLREHRAGPMQAFLQVVEARERCEYDERQRALRASLDEIEFAAMVRRLACRARPPAGTRSFAIFRDGQSSARWVINIRGGSSMTVSAREVDLDRFHAAQRRLLMNPTQDNAEAFAAAERALRDRAREALLVARPPAPVVVPLPGPPTGSDRPGRGRSDAAA